MKTNSLLNDLANITSYAPWDLRDEDLLKLEEALKKAEELDSVSPSLSIKSVKLIFGLKSLYSDLIKEKPQKDPSISYLFKSLNLSIIAIRERKKEKAILLAKEALKEHNLAKMAKNAKEWPFITQIKYDNIYSQLATLLKTLEEIAETISEEKL